MNRHDVLIAELSSELAPGKPRPDINLVAAGWLLLSAVYVVLVTHLFGPIRPNSLSQLAHEPRFLLENLLGLAAIGLTAVAAFRSAIPGALGAGLIRVAAASMALWLASYVVGLFNPALEPSMLGKRDHCLIETFIYALPPVLAALLLVRRLYPLTPMRTAVALSLAAGMLPALYMQLACMYAPEHILKFHILPGMTVMFVGAGLAVMLLIKRPRRV